MSLMDKSNFPIFDTYPDLVYIDNSATTHKPRRVLEAVKRYYEEENANPLRGLYKLSRKATEVYEDARAAVRKFIGAASEREIVFTRNASESLNLVAYSYGRAFIEEGDEILSTVSEHHSNMLPWQMVAREKDAVMRYIEPSDKGEYTPEQLKAALTPRTKIFAIRQVSNVYGRENPIKEFARICHENGTVIVCDGAQSVPHMKVDVRDLDVDFLAFSSHKMVGPMGIGVLYGREELLEKMPPFMYGGEMIDYVTLDGATYAELPHKFEAGTVNAGGAAGLHAAMDYISRIGFDAIEEKERKLTKLLFDGLSAIPHIHIIGSDKAEEHLGIVAFTVDGVHPHDVAQLLDEDNICVRAGHHCTQPLHKFLCTNASTRASLAFYNDEEDIARFIASMKTVRRRMGYGD